jgi:TolB-like protein/DNA-binding winged helix-turn-helix (wHTH) protein/Flp pilus assembly protein TadD
MSSQLETNCVFRFDVFELDIRVGELRKRGVKLRLQGQPLQVLATLLKRAGDLVTREQLREQIWPSDTFVDFDHSLHNAIARLREVLGDSAEAPRYIETLHRRGYRFIAPVQGAEVQADSVPVRTEPSGETGAKPHGYRSVVALATLVLAFAGLSLWAVRASEHRASAAHPLDSIAVLPLNNLTGDPSQEYFVDGMTDELITELAKVGTLRVISRTSVMRYKGTKKSLPEIARELNVEAVVEGSVTRSGQRVRITAQLLHAPSDRHLWAETYERDLGDVLKLQSSVAETIAQQVRAQLTPQQRAQLRSARAVDPEAYEAYLRGRYYLTNQYTMTQPLNSAKSYFEESVRKDPGFALGYSGLADAYVYLAFYGQGQLPPDRAYRSAKDALQKAVQLDDSIGEVHDTLGQLNWRFDWNWEGAEKEFNESIALAPSYSCAHEDRALFLSFMGRRDEALAEVAKSNELDPGPGSSMVESAVYYQLRDYERLVEQSRKGVASYPNEWVEHYLLGVGYEATGRSLEAISEYLKAVELSEGNLDAKAALAHAYAAAGRRADADKILHDLQEKSKTAYVSPYFIATVYAGLGDKERAFAFLEKAYQEKSLELGWQLKADLRLDNLRADPRFENVLHRVGLTT